MFPLRVDVTKDVDTMNAATFVSKWIKDPAATSPRYLHAVVNNAGIGGPGLIDWSSISTYQKVMDGEFLFPEYIKLFVLFIFI